MLMEFVLISFNKTDVLKTLNKNKKKIELYAKQKLCFKVSENFAFRCL